MLLLEVVGSDPGRSRRFPSHSYPGSKIAQDPDPDIPSEKCMVIWQIVGNIFLRSKFRRSIRNLCCILLRFGNL
jgi:hypothetical protein